jgi:hypothetical protein
MFSFHWTSITLLTRFRCGIRTETQGPLTWRETPVMRTDMACSRIRLRMTIPFHGCAVEHSTYHHIHS